MDSVNIIVTGKLTDGTDFEKAVTQMAAMTRLDRERIERLLRAGQPTVVKRNVPVETGEKYRAALAGIGVEVELQPIEPEPENPGLRLERELESPSIPPPVPVETEPQERRQAPPPISSTGQTSGQAGPSSRTKWQEGRGDGQVAGSGPVTVPASHGWLWIKEAVDLYLEERLCWTGMVLIMGVLAILVSLVPGVGSFVTTVLGPVFAGGLMLAAAARQHGQSIQLADLFGGFSQRRNPLLMLGLFHLAYAFLLGIVVVIIMMLFFAGASMVKDAHFMQQHFLGILLLAMFAGVLTVPAAMGFWFAPSLIALGKMDAWASIKASFSASLKNWSALLVYGLIVLLASLVVGMLVGLAAGLTGALLPTGGSRVLIPVLALALASPSIAVFTLTGYTSYRDIFRQDATKVK